MTIKHGAKFVMDFVKCHFIVFMTLGAVIDSCCCHCEVIFKQHFSLNSKLHPLTLIQLLLTSYSRKEVKYKKISLDETIL